MKKECDIVQDLLPLYIDDACSVSSREYVDAHIGECQVCSQLLRKMKDEEIESELAAEKSDVIGRQAQVYKRKSFIAGAVIAGIFMIPVLVCFIVSLASGAALGWFFIVLVSLILAASLIVVPLMVPNNKLLWTLGTGTAALLLLYGVCCIYSGGHWFFVAASSTLFGLAVCFMPFVVRSRVFRPRLGNQKSLVCMGVDTVLFWIMMIFANGNNNPANYWSIVLAISVPLLVYVWGIFALLRYPRCRYLARVGMCLILTGAAMLLANNIIGAFMGYNLEWPVLDPLDWTWHAIDGNVKWMGFIVFVTVGVILTIIGLAVKGEKHENNK